MDKQVQTEWYCGNSNTRGARSCHIWDARPNEKNEKNNETTQTAKRKKHSFRKRKNFDVKMNHAQNVRAANIAYTIAMVQTETPTKITSRPRRKPCEVISNKTDQLRSATIREKTAAAKSASEMAPKISLTPPTLSNTWASVRMNKAQRIRAEQVKGVCLVREKAEMEEMRRRPQIRELRNSPGSKKGSRGAFSSTQCSDQPTETSSVEYTSREASLEAVADSETSSLDSWVVVSRCNSESDNMSPVGSDTSSLSESELRPTESEVSLPYLVDMYTNELKPKPKPIGVESVCAKVRKYLASVQHQHALPVNNYSIEKSNDLNVKESITSQNEDLFEDKSDLSSAPEAPSVGRSSKKSEKDCNDSCNREPRYCSSPANIGHIQDPEVQQSLSCHSIENEQALVKPVSVTTSQPDCDSVYLPDRTWCKDVTAHGQDNLQSAGGAMVSTSSASEYFVDPDHLNGRRSVKKEAGEVMVSTSSASESSVDPDYFNGRRPVKKEAGEVMVSMSSASESSVDPDYFNGRRPVKKEAGEVMVSTSSATESSVDPEYFNGRRPVKKEAGEVMVSTSSASESSVDPDHLNDRRPVKKEAGGIMNYLGGISRRFMEYF